MKALVYTGPKSLEVREVKDPSPAAGDTMLTLATCGICGSDMHAYLGHDDRRPAPLILGHEAAGVTDDGRRVTVNPLVTCGECRACRTGRDNLCTMRQIISMPPREGAFAERLAMPEGNLVEIPDALSLEHAALAEPLAVCWHAAQIAARISQIPLQDTRCLVIGGGAIGLGAALALRAMDAGAIDLAETNPIRRTLLTGEPGVRVLDPTDADLETPDIVIDAVGVDATRALASRIVAPGGVIAHVGLGTATGGLDIRRLTLQEITFVGTYTYTMTEFRHTVDLIANGAFGALSWVATRPLEEGAAAFADLLAGKEAHPKVQLSL